MVDFLGPLNNGRWPVLIDASVKTILVLHENLMGLEDDDYGDYEGDDRADDEQ